MHGATDDHRPTGAAPVTRLERLNRWLGLFVFAFVGMPFRMWADWQERRAKENPHD